MQRTGELLLFIAALLGPPPLRAMGTAPPTSPSGVVVEEVRKGSPGEGAGLQKDDVLLSWSRAEAGGDLRSPFDLAAIALEEAPRGAVLLRGTRHGAPSAWTLDPGEWDLRVIPLLRGEPATAFGAGQERIAAGDLEAGLELWRTGAAAARAAGDLPTAAWLLLRQARALVAVPRWPDADAAFGTAVEALRQVLPAGTAQLLREWGDTYQRRGEWSHAVERYQQALAIDRATSPESLAVAASLNPLGVTASLQGDLAGGDQLFQQALAIRQKLAPDSFVVAVTLTNLGIGDARKGDVAKAEGYFRQALAIQEKAAPGSRELARTLMSLGNLATMRGDLDAAEELYQRCLARQEELQPGGPDSATTLGNLGIIAMTRGELAKAEDFHRKALAIDAAESPDGLAVATHLNNLGIIAWRRKDLDAADEFHRRALAIRDRLAPDSPDVADSLANLGLVANDRGDVAAAESYLRRALAIREKRTPDSIYAATLLTSLGMLRVDNGGDLAAAEGLHRRALAIAEKQFPGSLLVSDNLHSLAIAADLRGHLKEAEEIARRSLALREKLAPFGFRTAESWHDLGVVLGRQGRSAEATEAYCHAVDVLDSQWSLLGGSDEQKSAFGAGHASYYHDCLAALILGRRPDAAFHVLERGRARSFLRLLGERDLRLSGDLDPHLAAERRRLDGEYDRIQGGISRLSPGRDDTEIAERLGRLREIRTQQEELVERIRRSAPRFAALRYPQPLDLAAARAALDPGTALLAYSVGQDETFLFVVRSAGNRGKGLAVLRLPIGDAALRDAVQTFRNLLARPASDRPRLAAQAQRLYDLLVRPAERQITPAARLVVCTDGPLGTLPFAALLRRGRYLVEWKPVSTAPSATVWAELAHQRRSGAAPGPLAAFGAPVYPSPAAAAGEGADSAVRSAARSGLSLELLPGSRAEVESIAALLPQARTYLGAAATEEAVKALGADVRLVHFACHGLLDERSPLDSALALTIPEHPSLGQDNGLLQAWEIFESVRLDADLVTLSACDSALGKEMAGEGLIGLTRAFQYAGARSVLASLWSVSDTSTAELMRRFYIHLLHGESKDQALRAAQIELIRGPKATSHPYHWAAFELSGDWR